MNLFFYFKIVEIIVGSKYNWYIFCLYGVDWGYLGLVWFFFYCFVCEDVGILVDIWYDLLWLVMVENVIVIFDDFFLIVVIYMDEIFNFVIIMFKFYINVFDKFFG